MKEAEILCTPPHPGKQRGLKLLVFLAKIIGLPANTAA